MTEEAPAQKKDTIDPKTGMPDLTEEEKEKAKKGKLLPVIFPMINMIFGFGIAYGVYSWGDKDKFDSRITIVNSYDL